MKVLICTQVVDRNHPILGFFHGWLAEFAKQTDQVHVIALQVGDYDLPENVTVHSLGKESGKGRFTYVVRFFSLIVRLRSQYDSVFVHMNQIYVLLGSAVWRMLGKKVGLWYAHGSVTASLRLAVMLADDVFTSTPEGMRVASSKKRIVGQGVDPNRFNQSIKENPQANLQLITVGRIAPSKNIETLFQACVNLCERQIDFTFTVVGVATTPTESEYEQQMKQLTNELGLSEKVVWYGGVANEELPALLQKSDIFIHDGSTNSLDKTLIEAAMSGCVVLSSNPAYRGEVIHIAQKSLFSPKDSTALSAAIISCRQDKAMAAAVCEHFRKKYSVTQLIDNILGHY